ncbi:MAG: heavy metal-binding domain-containing protein [bacterium]
MKSDSKMSGLSGNEMYCVDLLGFTPGNIVIGNSVFSMGLIGSIGSSLRTIAGGEIKQFTNMIAEGRRLSLERFDKELAENKGSGASGVSSQLVFHPGNIEFLSVGSTIHNRDNSSKTFSTSADGQELFCQWDAGYTPISFVFGNVAYSIGIGRGIIGSFRKLAKGEVKQFSDIFNTTRNLSIERISNEAKIKGANSVVGVRTTILPIATTGVQEMVMIGTASSNPKIEEIAKMVGGVTTSDLTAEETWNVAKLGYAPMKVIIGTSVYSLGFIGGVASAFKNLVKGEISQMTELIYGARENSLAKVKAQADEIGADDVLGIKTYVYSLGGGVIEFLAIGTAVKRVSGIAPKTANLPPQAIIRDKDTFVNKANYTYGSSLQNPTRI